MLQLDSSTVVHFHNFSPLERGQPEWISTVLDSKDAHQKAVHAEKHGAPDDDSYLLSSGVLYSGHLEGQCNSGKG